MARRRDSDPIDRLFSPTAIDTRRRTEIISLACRLFMQGKSAEDMRQEFSKKKYGRYSKQFTREASWRLLRKAALNGWFEFRPPLEVELAGWLARSYAWTTGRVTVVASPHLDDIAAQAAGKLLELIQFYRGTLGHDPVHIGFAGGRTLRRVAARLAQLLRKPAKENPKRIVFHAMVAAFGDEDFILDPNNFISYFIDEPVHPKVSFVRMPAPGVVETGLRDQLKEFGAIRQVYEKADDIHIIVTGGGSWRDPHSSLRNYLSEFSQSDVAELEKRETLGDLLWQPMSSHGPIRMEPPDVAFRANTLIELGDLPKFIDNRVRVLCVLGSCPECGEPHGELLDAILGAKPALVTDVITDVANVHDLHLKGNHVSG